MINCIGIINLDENENGMGELIKNRPLAAIPIAGRYRVIDFVLSNMTNSGIDSIGIFTKNRSRSLVDHITNGRPWDLHRKTNGLRIFNFGDKDPYYDDVYNFADNIEFFTKKRKDYVLLASSYMICNIDYKKVVDYHKKQNNDITIIHKKIENGNNNFIECDILNLDNQNKVNSIGKNLGKESKLNISMEMYVMKTELFIDIIYESIRTGSDRKVKSYITNNLKKLNVGAYEYEGYLSCVNSVGSYYKINMELLKPELYAELFLEKNAIYTKSNDEIPTYYGNNSNVKNSVIANGSHIEGNVENCMIGRGVVIKEGAILKNCVIMQKSIVGENSYLESVIADKSSNIEENEKVIGLWEYPMVLKKPSIL